MDIKYHEDLFKKITAGLTETRGLTKYSFLVFPFVMIFLTLCLIKDFLFCGKNCFKLMRSGYCCKLLSGGLPDIENEDGDQEKDDDDRFKKVDSDKKTSLK